MSPHNVLNDPVYKKWIQSNSKATHFILDEKLGIRKHEKVVKLLEKLIDEEVYHLEKNAGKFKKCEENIKYLYTGTKVLLSQNLVETFHLNFYSGYVNSPKLPIQQATNDDPYPKIHILGTSSANIQVLRNSSCYLVYLSENSSILMDCGEGTLGQIICHFGEENYKNEIKKIKAIYISHAHGDHQLGLMNILNERKKIDDKNLLYLCIPDNLNIILHPLQRLFKEKQVFTNVKILLTEWFSKHFLDDLNESVKQVAEAKTNDLSPKQMHKIQFDLKTSENINNFIKYLDLVQFETTLVNHMPFSCGLSIQLKNKFRLAYFGDCRPTKNFIKMIKNCDLLIHESTFSPDKIAMAKHLFHSTVDEAISVANEANAKHLILTHFGTMLSLQIDYIFYDSTKFDNVGIAFDHMIVNRLNLHKIPTYNKAVRDAFKYLD